MACAVGMATSIRSLDQLEQLARIHTTSEPECLLTLTKLDVSLSECGLDMAHASSFAQLVTQNATRLRSLDVSFNDLPSQFFQGLSNNPAFALRQLEQLSFANNILGDESADLIHRILSTSRSLRELDLSLNHFGFATVQAIVSSQQVDASSLVVLDLTGNQLGDDACCLLGDAFATNWSLQHLRLEVNSLHDQAAVAMAHGMPRLPSLRTLSLAGNEIGDDGACALAFALDHTPTLRDLLLQDNQIQQDGVIAFINILKSCNPFIRLAQLRLDGNPAAPLLLRQLHQLVDELLVFNYLTEQADPKSVLLNGDMARSLFNVPIDDASIASVLKTLRNATFLDQLVVLDLSDNEIGDDGASQLGVFLLVGSAPLHTLNLAHNSIQDPGAEALALGLVACPTMHELNISYNQLGDSGATRLHLVLFDLSSPKRDTKRRIIVHGNQLSRESRGMLDAIVQARELRDDESLLLQEVVDLTGRNLRSYGAAALAKLLTTNVHCKSLLLARNRLGNDGAFEIARLMARNTSLTKLDLSCNDISDQGLKELARVLECNRSLKTFVLQISSGCSTRAIIFDDGFREFATRLQANQTLEILDLRENPMTVTARMSFVRLLENNQRIRKFNGTATDVFLSRNE